MMKSLLLAGAAGLATVSLAQAADLPMEKAEAVEYVKVCTEFGEGFFYIPGTDTCLKLSGHVRAGYRFFGDNDLDPTSGTNDFNRYDFNHNFRLNVDARTATEFGTLRSFAELNFNSDKGSAGSIVGKAYIQLGGLTAGYAASVYNFYDTNYGDTIFAGYYAPSATVNQLSYTATFGGGFYASLSVEEGHRNSIRGVRQTLVNIPPAAVTATGDVVEDLLVGYGGQEIPDLVGAIGVSQSWGKAQIMAAAHQVRYNEYSSAGLAAGLGAAPGLPAIPGVGDDEWGYAVGAGVAVNLPIAAGGWVVVEANYADGAVSYLGYGGPDAVVFTPRPDATSTAAQGWSADNSKGWSIVAEGAVQITPSLLFVAFGSYVDVDWGNPSGQVVLDGLTYTGSAQFDNEKAYIVGANLTYTITKGLKIAGEIDYSSREISKIVDVDPTAGVVAGSVSDTFDSWEGGIRLERSF